MCHLNTLLNVIKSKSTLSFPSAFSFSRWPQLCRYIILILRKWEPAEGSRKINSAQCTHYSHLSLLCPISHHSLLHKKKTNQTIHAIHTCCTNTQMESALERPKHTDIFQITATYMQVSLCVCLCVRTHGQMNRCTIPHGAGDELASGTETLTGVLHFAESFLAKWWATSNKHE